MMFSNVIVEISFPRRPLVFSQFRNVASASLSPAPCLFFAASLSLTFVSNWRLLVIDVVTDVMYK